MAFSSLTAATDRSTDVRGDDDDDDDDVDTDIDIDIDIFWGETNGNYLTCSPVQVVRYHLRT